jgi:protocatechuate 3,4-dioxygenase beta subunit
VTRRRGVVAAALLIVVVAIVWWVSRDRGYHARPAQIVAPRGEDTASAARLRAIRNATSSLAPALPKHVIRGRVIDTTGTPVPDAIVALGHPALETRSGKQGEFTFPGVVPGRYAVEARKGPLVGGPVSVQLDADREVTLVVRRGAVLRIEVVSAKDQHPIPNAEIHISQLSMYDHAGEQRARTGADGVAELPGVTLVAHSLWVGAEGFVDFTDSVDPMVVEGGSLKFRVEMQPGVTVAGRVVDADTGQPIAGAAIDGFEGNRQEGARRDDRHRIGDAPTFAPEVRGNGTRSDEQGRFRIGLAPGPWTVVASHPRYATTGTFIAVTASPLDVQINCTKGKLVHGIVVTQNDRPVPGAEIEARWQFGGRVERTTQADGRGRFELSGLPAAPMEILARAADGSSTPQRFDLAQLVPDDDVLLVIDNTGAITGRVLRDKQPLPGAQVFYVEQGSIAKVHPGVVNTDASGAFRITGVAADRTYVLNAMPQQDGDAWFRPGPAVAKAGADVTIEIPADAILRGRVEVAGARVTDVTVEIEGNTPPRRVAADGKFAFVGIPGGPRNLLFRGKSVADRRVLVEVNAGEDHDAGVIKLSAGRTLTGRVIDGKDKPVADAEIFVHGDNMSELHTMVGADGTFSIVVPGDQELVVDARARRGGMATATVAPRSTAALVLRLPGAAVLEGAIMKGGNPAVDAIVELRKPGDAGDRPYSYTQTDGAGFYRMQGIEPGNYELEVVHDQKRTKQAVQVKEGTSYQNVELPP